MRLQKYIARNQSPFLHTESLQTSSNFEVDTGGLSSSPHRFSLAFKSGNWDGQDGQPNPQFYRHLLAFVFAVDEINSNPYILPNVTLGYHVLDSCGHVNKAVENVLHILSGPVKTVPNYSCRKYSKVVGVIGDLSSQTSLHIANIMNLYGFPQISYGATDPVLSNKRLYPNFYQTLQNDQAQFDAIVKLLRYFGWNWVGIIASDDDSGETQRRELEKMAAIHGICIEFSLQLPPNKYYKRIEVINRNRRIINRATSQIVILCGTASYRSMYLFTDESGDIHQKTFIIPASWNVIIYNRNESSFPFNGSLVFTRPDKMIPSLQNFLENVRPSNRPNDILLEDIRAYYFNCLTSNPVWNGVIQYYFKTGYRNCSATEGIIKLGRQYYDTVRFGTTYHVYKAVYAMASSLHEMQLYIIRNPENPLPTYQQFLRKVHFRDPTGEEVYFKENGEMPSVYHVKNQIFLPNGNNIEKHVAIIDLSAPEGKQLNIRQRLITWKYNTKEVPYSRCSKDCLSGYRRVLQRGKHTCCFDCVQCSEGEISNKIDKDSCQKCADDQWPNEKKDKCVKKPTEFLSYDQDAVAMVLCIISVTSSVITCIILGIFILYQDTPIVKANNRNLSFVLLVSLILSFLCVFLFLGRPEDVTCMLRQTAFGVIFSVAVSSLLAKTLMVCIAFKATKPGSKWRKYIGVKIPNFVVFICSFIQVVICICWLSISPPYQEMNIHSYPGKIIIQCNEGSVVAFYTVLGYMGFLAAVSFVVAFLARKLPDSFNEAKYITFSMLIFCNVWISFIPAYMSVMGKNTVIVEIFAILTSSAGILGCLFFPKCCIILLRPDMNSKKHLLRLEC
ncbi:vomeronasal type-2 receptor 26-like [Spea bombifrons]|uniref:vomeronasal type-2 receptor 26-like n=1 Tax=Spea bombifrons TaxID=233779 RepID=UPI00234B2ABA|nr:vomeronasal type-2 receptor 26-like [Spea bombifrons]